MPRYAIPSVPRPCVREVWRYAPGGNTAELTGDIYTDGSGLSPIGWPEANRAGWGIPMTTGQTVRGLVYGPLPGHQQSVPRAELYAVMAVLRDGVAPLHMRTDCLGVVEGLQHGREWRVHPRRPN